MHSLEDSAPVLRRERDPAVPRDATGADIERTQVFCETRPRPESNVFLPDWRPDVPGLIELILKDRPRLDRVIRDPSLAAELLPRLLAVALGGFTLFGVALAIEIAACGVWPAPTAISTILADHGGKLVEFLPLDERIITPWREGRAPRLVAAYDLGLIAAAGICLPSLYFYCLLAGVRMTMVDVVLHTLKAMATTAVALVGILPIYMAICLGVALLPLWEPFRNVTLWLGMLLPFIAGVWGMWSLYVGFTGLADTIDVCRRWERACFLRRLVLSWGACYTAVTPVMIFTLWEYFGRS